MESLHRGHQVMPEMCLKAKQSLYDAGDKSGRKLYPMSGYSQVTIKDTSSLYRGSIHTPEKDRKNPIYV